MAIYYTLTTRTLEAGTEFTLTPVNMPDQPTPMPSPIKRLEIPWASQLGPEAAYSNNDCGPACVAMLLKSLGKPCTVDQVSRATGLALGYKGTNGFDLSKAAAVFGIKLARYINVSIDDLIADIDRGVASIALVLYPDLPERYDPKFSGCHWVLFVGYRRNEAGAIDAILFHDPYWPDTTGRYKSCTPAQFTRAMQDVSSLGNAIQIVKAAID